MMRCAQEFLRNGIVRWESDENIKQILVETNQEFYEFADEQITTGRYNNASLYEEFTTKYRCHSNISKRKFAMWVKAWAEFKKWKFERKKSNGCVFFHLTDETQVNGDQKPTGRRMKSSSDEHVELDEMPDIFKCSFDI